MVPIPPIEAAYATPRRKTVDPRLPLTSEARKRVATPSAIGTIINVVEVFDIHMLRNAVAVMNPRIKNFSPDGQALTIIRAILR